MIIDPKTVEKQFTTYEAKDPVGNVLGFMMQCNTCQAKGHFMKSDRPKTRQNKLLKFLAEHEHQIILAN